MTEREEKIKELKEMLQAQIEGIEETKFYLQEYLKAVEETKKHIEFYEKISDAESAPVSSISDLFRNDQSKVFLPESVDILTWKEWSDLQSMHDAIARKWEGSLKCAIKDLNLFTYEELVEYSSKL